MAGRSRWARLAAVTLMVLAMSSAFTFNAYAADVSSGRVVACRWVKLAVDRHLRDLARVGAPDFPFYFDEALASRAVAFIQNLPHTKGVWASTYGGKKPLIALEPWEQFIVSQIHGWRRLDGFRRFTRAYVEVARKNGKTTLGAGLGNYAFHGDVPAENGPEVYFAATKQEQAAIAWREAKLQIQKTPALAKRSKTYESHQVIVQVGDDGKQIDAARMRPLGRDSNTEDGLNPSFALIDEYHAHPDSSLLDVLESGMGSREQPLALIITTAGLDKAGPCYTQEHQLAENILGGVIDPVPENQFAIIFTIDDGDDWADPSVWIKANPNLGISVKPEYIAERVKIALAVPAKQNEVKTKNLNVWTQAATRWILDDKWLACREEFAEDDLLGRHCHLAFDLSSTTDLTALCLSFRPAAPGERWRHIWRFFMPEENLLERERQDRVPYTVWSQQGLIIATPGNVVDYDYVEMEIRELAKRFVIDEIVYDPWKAQEIVNHLSPEFTMVQCAQRYNPMALYSDTFEKKILARELAHDGNPIMRWMISCVEVKSDRQGNVMPMKPQRDKSGKRIDGVVACIMALGRAVVFGDGSSSSVYSSEEVMVL